MAEYREPTRAEREALIQRLMDLFGYDDSQASLCACVSYDYFTDLVQRLDAIYADAARRKIVLENIQIYNNSKFIQTKGEK